MLGPNESGNEPVATVTTNDVMPGTLTGTSVAIIIVQSSNFNYFFDIPKPLPVQVTVNVTLHLAAGDVIADITFSASLDSVEKSDDDAIIDPIKYFTAKLTCSPY